MIWIINFEWQSLSWRSGAKQVLDFATTNIVVGPKILELGGIL